LNQSALLVLADGSVFRGTAIGALGQVVGEVVFNTAMTGYQEILTDASYAKQIVMLTYPHIGNAGVNPDDAESDRVWVEGLIIRDLPPTYSNWRGQQSLSDYLKQHGKVAIAGIDTRQLTNHLRTHGVQSACLVAGNDNVEQALAAAKAFPGLQGMDLAKVVSTQTKYEWKESSISLDAEKVKPIKAKHHVVVYDFGVKRNILRLLIDHGCRVTVVPAQTSAKDVLVLKPDGVVLSNGPGDPEPCTYAIVAARELLEKEIPIFGICLGHQLLGLACGAKTIKIKFGHHGANHPVQDLKTKKVLITSQNHGFAVDESSLPKELHATHRSLFDGTLQGIEHINKPAFSFQGHPEASPGPLDVNELFAKFVRMMEKNN
jgi:carbamoyl-phosphate synthase small subunit